ncbi:ABC transporter substrate-binding protein [Helicovermis profundi]|uniref:Fe/B12 periplasmic-binding domain-containing protein n=1 Tax=Helicovermis profundi TaxID=3065157 RepID=A0AAU9E2W6_9FIRM|nr:hypothetical protein HLPR_12150 [Clostridia bacterium S502]
MKKNIRSIILVVLILIISLSLVACNKSSSVNNNINSKDNQSIKIDEKNTDDSSSVKELRIVTTYKPATNIVLALGGVKNLVGANDSALKDKLINSLDSTAKDRILEIGSKKHGINIEEVVSLKPDLVIMFPTKDTDETVKKLENQGIKVVSIYPENIELLQNEILNIANAMGKKETGEKLVKYFNDKLEFIDSKIKNISEEDRKTIYLAGARGILSTSAGTFYQHELMERAGGIDVAGKLKGGWNEVSIEQLLKWNPDVITSIMYTPKGTPKEILSNGKLSKISAIINKEVYQMPSNIEPWDMPEPSSILGMLWLSKTLYPNEFTDYDFSQDVDSFYKEFYGKSFKELGGKL